MMQQTRREFCKQTAASGAMLGMAAAVPAAMSATLLSGRPAHAQSGRIALGGGASAASFSDGTMRVPVTMLFPADAPAPIKKLLAESGMAGEQAARPLNVSLVEIGDRKILFDAGSGANFLPGLGQLPAALESAGVETAAITDVIFTHAHPDHIWGVVDDFDELLIPDARYHISRDEWDFWDSDATLAALPEDRKSFAVGAKARFDALRERINFFAAGGEVAPGVEAVSSPGHTPGHASFVIHGPDKKLMVLGDAITHPLISFAAPEFPNNSDWDREQAATTRAMLLDRMTADDMILIGYHLPASGIGRAEKSGSAYRFVPS